MRKSPIYVGALGFCVIVLGVSLHGSALEAAVRTRVHLGLEGSLRILDPRQSVDAQTQTLNDLIHCSLMNFDAEGQLIPGIAKESPTWKSAQVLELTLRDDVKFSDGRAVTADDVVASYQSVLTDSALAQSASYRMLDTVQARGSTIIFSLKEADASFPGKLALGILPAKFARSSSIDSSKMPVCGPYFIKSSEATRIILEKNPHAVIWPQARFQHIEITFEKNAKSLFAQLQKGELDLVQNSLEQDALKAIARKNLPLNILKRPSLNTSYLAFNLRDPIAGHPSVREAIAHAVDRQQVITRVLGGLATPATSLLPPSSPFQHKALRTRALDLRKAETLLDEAGFKRKGSTRFELSYKTTTEITQIQVAKAIAAQLNSIGIKLVVQPLERRVLDEDLRQGRMQLWSLSWTGITDPDAYREAFSSQSEPASGRNPGRYSNPKLDTLLEKGRINNSAEQRKMIYQQVQELVDQDLPCIFLWHPDHVVVTNRKLKGFTPHADGRYMGLTQAFFSDQGS
jgi:peptide/nickel transport system substrate-binding protein